MRSLPSALGVLGGLATVVFGALGFAAASVGPDAIGPDPTVVIAISIVGVLGGVVALVAAVASRRRQP